MKPVLEALLNDPAFYSPEVVGSQILSPVEFLVGACRRLGASPPGEALARASTQLGQGLLYPPNVKGWEGGEAWITTSTFLQRGNIAGYLVEGFDPREVRRELKGAQAGLRANRAFPGFSRRGAPWKPNLQISRVVQTSGAKTLEEVVDCFCDQFLGVPITKESREQLILFAKGSMKEDEQLSETVLRKLVRLILSLPEAQLG
jgi:hypothetical protein